MPTITVNKQDLIELLGFSLSDKKLRETINCIKPEVESISPTDLIYELNPDRPDLFSSPGLARAMKGYLEKEVGAPKYRTEQSEVTVTTGKVEIRPYIACALIKELQLTPTIVEQLMKFQENLHRTIGRNRRKVAIGLHNFKEVFPPIHYGTSPPTKQMLPLQGSKNMSLRSILLEHPKGKKFSHIIADAETFPTIIDQKGIFSFPPIINSKRTRISSTSTDLFVDVTGTSFSAVDDVMNILTTSLAERGGKIQKLRVRYPNHTYTFPTLKKETQKIRSGYINDLIGLDLSPKEIVKLLEKMRFNLEIANTDEISVSIPPFRTDILHPVDLIEDICIAYNYDEFSPAPTEKASIGGLNQIERFSTRIRETMIGLGFQEVMNPTLTSKETLIEKMCLKEKNLQVVEIANPVSKEYEVCRNQLLPTLLEFLSKNVHIKFPQKVFELEDVIVIRDGTNKTKNIKKLSIVISNHEIGYSDLRATLDALLKQFGITYEVKPINHPSFIKGRVGEVLLHGKDAEKKLGIIGEVHPKVLVNFGLKKPVGAIEIRVDTLHQFF